LEYKFRQERLNSQSISSAGLLGSLKARFLTASLREVHRQERNKSYVTTPITNGSEWKTPNSLTSTVMQPPPTFCSIIILNHLYIPSGYPGRAESQPSNVSGTRAGTLHWFAAATC
jgi:hypothetical protein